jgi:hypothetical protein
MSVGPCSMDFRHPLDQQNTQLLQAIPVGPVMCSSNSTFTDYLQSLDPNITFQ